MRGQSQRFAHLGVGGVDHGGLDGAHRGGALAHIEDRRRPTPHDRRARAGELVDRDPADALGGVLHHRAQQGDRRAGARQGHGDDLGRDARPRQLDQVLRAELAPDQRRRRAHIEHGVGLVCQRLPASGEDRQHVDHVLHGVCGERSGDDRLGGVQQHQVQAVQVADLFGDIVAHHGGGLGVVLRQHLGHLDQAHQVRRARWAVLQRIGVEDVHARRAGVEMHASPP